MLVLLDSHERDGSQAILAFPQLAKYDGQWPAVDLVRQYLENSASYRTNKVTYSSTVLIRRPTLKAIPTSQATVVLKKRLNPTGGVVSRGGKTRGRGENHTVIQPNRSQVYQR